MVNEMKKYLEEEFIKTVNKARWGLLLNVLNDVEATNYFGDCLTENLDFDDVDRVRFHSENDEYFEKNDIILFIDEKPISLYKILHDTEYYDWEENNKAFYELIEMISEVCDPI